MTSPHALTQEGITVRDVDAVKWYEETLGYERIFSPMITEYGNSHIGEVYKDIFGNNFKSYKIRYIQVDMML